MDAFKTRIELLLNEFRAFENADGLLENTPGHPFIDWSSSNLPEYMLPISTASNALYAQVLDCIASLYSKPDLSEQASSIRKILQKNARKGAYFSDSLTRQPDGTFVPGRFSSEAAQYYLFWCGVGRMHEDAAIWKSLAAEHGPLPDRYPSDLMLARSNVFIGQYVRFELLSQNDEHTPVLKEIRHLFGFMIDHGPGTLWENLSDSGSLCHGLPHMLASGWCEIFWVWVFPMR